MTNLPDENCVFVPSGDNANVRSSLMGAPFLASVDKFCEGSEIELHHDRYKPTKHNFMCQFRPTWDVIKGNIDFIGVTPMDVNNPAPETIFKILQPDQGGRFTLVLDRSGSMNDNSRWTRLVQSSSKWITYDLNDGALLGITSFR